MILAVVNQKGGVSKTTTSAYLGAAFALNGLRVLGVDVDPQGNLTSAFGQADFQGTRLYDALLDTKSTRSAIGASIVEGFDLLYGSRDTALCESEFPAKYRNPYIRLGDALETVKDDYDVIILDCPPSLGFATVSAMIAADGLVIPTTCDKFAMDGIQALLSTLRSLQDEKMCGPKPARIVVSIYDGFDKDAVLFEQQLRGRTDLGADVAVCATRVRKGQNLKQAMNRYVSVFETAPTSAGALDFKALANELAAPAPAPAAVS